MAYSGKFPPKNTEKYAGDPTKIVYRSLWERQTFRWCDENPDILSWNSEEVVIPYRCKTDRKMHRYFVDLYVRFRDHREYIIEIKPKIQTQPPKQPKRKSKRFITEVMAYAKNTSKWDAAQAYAEDRGWTFQIWTEETLRGLGIKILKSGKG